MNLQKLSILGSLLIAGVVGLIYNKRDQEKRRNEWKDIYVGKYARGEYSTAHKIGFNVAGIKYGMPTETTVISDTTVIHFDNGAMVNIGGRIDLPYVSGEELTVRENGLGERSINRMVVGAEERVF